MQPIRECACPSPCCLRLRRCRSLRNDSSWWIGVFTGLAYVYMVMVWGGYIFVLNMIGMHAGLLWITGQFSEREGGRGGRAGEEGGGGGREGGTLPALFCC